jgi:hypothetical protein
MKLRRHTPAIADSDEQQARHLLQWEILRSNPRGSQELPERQMRPGEPIGTGGDEEAAHSLRFLECQQRDCDRGLPYIGVWPRLGTAGQAV